MGFYSPQSLVADARRHGVTVHGPDINASLAHATLEPAPPTTSTGDVAVRLGLGSVRDLGDAAAQAVVDERTAGGPFRDLGDLGHRVTLGTPAMEALATAGAFAGFTGDRRRALWAAGVAARTRAEHIPGVATGLDAPALPGMTAFEVTAADLWATGVSGVHPVEHLRAHLDSLGAIPAAGLADVEDGTRVLVGGAVTHRQRPATAGGITFMNLEDETGMINVVISQGLWRLRRVVARTSAALLIRGQIQASQGVVNLVADRLDPLDLRVATTSRDFR
jgi:error-prone DNA polymerase